MTKEKDNSETRRKGAPNDRPPPDPRVVEFVRMLARHAAEQDYARLVMDQKARNPLPEKD